MTKTERKSEYNKLKKTLKDVWATETETDEEVNSDKMDVPSHYKKYTIQDRKIIVQQPMRELKEPGTTYDGPEKAKKIDLAEPGEESKPAYIATDLTEEEEQLLITTLKQYKDVFAWSYKDLKGVDSSICQHTIPLKSDAKPSRQRPYTYNETFARKIKKEIDKLKEAKFIYEIKHTDWVSPIVVALKKNEKLRVCVNLKKVNAATIRDNYPLPITDHVIERVAGRDECEKAFQIFKQRLISAPILKAPDWDKIFHVHVDASAFAIGCILAQPGEKNMDFSISYSSRQLNSAEKNYTTTKREGLGMIYAVKKFRHYLLSNKFVFFVDHQALLYLVNKPCSTGRIVRWFIILLEFDFMVVVKKGITHQRADHLSRLMHGEAPTGIDDDLPDAYLFNIDMVPRWSEEVIPLLTIGSLYLTKQPSIIGASRSLVMLAGRLYKQGSDQILRLCIETHEHDLYLNQSHVQITGIHNGHAQTYQRLMRIGVYWPKMQQSVHNYIQSCLICTFQEPIEHATLFKITVAPKWSSYIVDYLTSGILPETMTLSRVKAITKEAEDYVLIEDNLYRRGKDGQLQMCAIEEEYVPILQQAHSGQAGGHFSAEKMAKSILYAGIWWPTLFMDAEEFVKRCDDCQRTKTPRGRDDMPLRPMMGARAFAKWGIDFVGPCSPAYKSHVQYIIMATDYLTKWVEAKATTKNDAKTTA
ncbi:hypothetical protein L7F22_011684 [Adiantum nelumboides]|nr:hypothetical protein [Adiantum nelumboides]